ncbi:MAG: IS1 family transposase [Bacteroidetes bacterium]|nr:IS1 family transposase [Bacteroidota bacterium]
MNCNYCTNTCIKKGIRNSVQKYHCKSCGKWQQQKYTYRKFESSEKRNIVSLTKEGASISSISRLIKRSKSIIQKQIFLAGKTINKPHYNEYYQDYELDEMSIKIAGQEDIYLIYAINRTTRKVIDFFIGGRTKENISKVVSAVLCYHPKTIYTDKLNVYPSLIPKKIHKPGRRLTNRIERKNLSLRNFIKRLSRSTLCFTRKTDMLEAVIKLVSWA